MSRPTVVTFRQRPTKPEFHAKLMLGLSRAQDRLGGPGGLADKLDMTTQGLGKVFSGSMPCAYRQWSLLEHEPTVLDDIAKAFGKKIVDENDSCANLERMSPAVVALLKKAIEAELDGRESHQELLDMERELREVQGLIDARLERCAALRAPTVVKSA